MQRIIGGERLIIDTGAVLNLTGDAWAQRMEAHLPAALPAEYEELSVPQGILGVGETPSKATQEATMPMGLKTRDSTTQETCLQINSPTQIGSSSTLGS